MDTDEPESEQYESWDEFMAMSHEKGVIGGRWDGMEKLAPYSAHAADPDADPTLGRCVRCSEPWDGHSGWRETRENSRPACTST